MPELPEVEVVKQSLERKILNLRIKKIKINDGKLRYIVDKNELFNLVGKKFKKIERRSKYLIFHLEKHITMIAHLGMTGKFFFINKKNKKFKTSFYYDLNLEKDKKHDRIIFIFQNDEKLIYNDIRKFGFVKFCRAVDYYKNRHIRDLGPEPLSKDWDQRYFKRYIFGRKRTIKSILMDQKFVSGLGNIYANEILFLSKIKPTRKVKKIKEFEIKKVINYTKKILKSSIKYGGSSIKDFSSDNGKKGIFQQYFKVYGRKGKTCSNIDCNSIIKRKIISNRATFFCNKCQK